MGEVGQRTGRPSKDVPVRNDISTAADIGLTRKEIHEVRIIRDAEVSEPGIVRTMIKRALEPKMKEAAKERQRLSEGRGEKGGGKSPTLTGRAADKLGAFVGKDRKTIEKIGSHRPHSGKESKA